MKTRIHLLLGMLAPVFFSLACAVSGAATPRVVTVVVTAPPAEPSPSRAASATPLPPASATPAALIPATGETPAPSATSGPRCTVLKRLNFRSGPGTAFVPILGVFDAGAQLTPTGFNPSGFPDGAWVQVTSPQDNRGGWVNAAAEFVSCNLDLSSLPSVAVQPPPTPSAPRVSNKPPEGPQGGDIQFEIVMDPNYLMQIRTRIAGSQSNGDGIDQVFFSVERNGEVVYEESEANPAFCIFKGGEPDCNPWPKSNGRYTWGAGGPAVETGDYFATIRITRDSDGSDAAGTDAAWYFTFTVDLP